MRRLLTLIVVLMFSFATLAPVHASSLRQAPAKAVKKDGTPDKRFKANKTPPPPPAGPKKKDGTADMRYKANKPAPKPAPPAPKPPKKKK